MKSNAGISAPKRKLQPRGKPFEKGNPHRFKPGQSGNPTGRPVRLGKTYAQWLAQVDRKTGYTNAMKVVEAMGNLAIAGDIAAAREIRLATEGDTINLPDVHLTDSERIARVKALIARADLRQWEASK